MRLEYNKEINQLSNHIKFLTDGSKFRGYTYIDVQYFDATEIIDKQ